jgi:hypothetical protein
MFELSFAEKRRQIVGALRVLGGPINLIIVIITEYQSLLSRAIHC